MLMHHCLRFRSRAIAVVECTVRPGGWDARKLRPLASEYKQRYLDWSDATSYGPYLAVTAETVEVIKTQEPRPPNRLSIRAPLLFSYQGPGSTCSNAFKYSMHPTLRPSIRCSMREAGCETSRGPWFEAPRSWQGRRQRSAFTLE